MTAIVYNRSRTVAPSWLTRVDRIGLQLLPHTMRSNNAMTTTKPRQLPIHAPSAYHFFSSAVSQQQAVATAWTLTLFAGQHSPVSLRCGAIEALESHTMTSAERSAAATLVEGEQINFNCSGKLH